MKTWEIRLKLCLLSLMFSKFRWYQTMVCNLMLSLMVISSEEDNTTHVENGSALRPPAPIGVDLLTFSNWAQQGSCRLWPSLLSLPKHRPTYWHARHKTYNVFWAKKNYHKVQLLPGQRRVVPCKVIQTSAIVTYRRDEPWNYCKLSSIFGIMLGGCDVLRIFQYSQTLRKINS